MRRFERRPPATSNILQWWRRSRLFFAYDAEHGYAWRADTTNLSAKEWAKAFAPDGATDLDNPLARFGDDPPVPIRCITVGDLRVTEELSSEIRRGRLWEGTGADGTMFHIAARKDRSPILCLCEHIDEVQKQICQAGVTAFHGDDAREQCLALMRTVVGKLMSGEITRDELYPTRDALMADKGIMMKDLMC